MSFLANTAFEPKVTNNRFDDLCNVAGVFYVDSAVADCSAGILVVRDALLPDQVFTGIDNLNTWKMKAATATTNTNDVVYACNTHDSQKLDGYYVGHRTLGLGITAGEIGVYTKIYFEGDKIYRFGVGNFTTAIGDNEYATIGANGQLVPAAAAPTDAGSLYFKILATGNFREGSSQSFGYVDVLACRVAVAG